MWALDLGTTNTILACWDSVSDRPRLIELAALCRHSEDADPLEAPRAIPSAVEVIEDPGWVARLGASGFLARQTFLGRLAHIGRPALEANAVLPRRTFAPTFKRQLARSPLVTLARAGGRGVSAREIARLFLRELLAEVKRTTGQRIRDLVVTAPVEAFESYRAELVAIGQHLGLRRIRFLDEPVAAALGYGLGLGSRKRVLVVDFGAGTLDMAVVNLTPESAQSGGCAVEAKAGRALGGNVVDAWLVEDFCRRLDYALRPDSDEARLWQRLMLIEACRVKEALYFRDAVSFELAPPEELRRFEARLRKGPAAVVELRRQDLVALLSERGLYAALDDCLASVLAQTRAKGFTEQDIDEVLMVGGSSLLPQVYSQFESRFGRDRVRAWQPFEAVAYGACAYAADHLAPADFIVHDYALLTHDRRTQKPQHTIVVPNGTRFPTAPDLWKQRLVPACSLGEPESIFKLVICEIGEAGADDERRFAWDREGKLRKLGGQPEHQANDGKLVVKLNDADPALGTLDPPHLPSDQRPRLEVSFGVNAERWLCATVCDLFSDKYLMRDEPVVRLL